MWFFYLPIEQYSSVRLEKRITLNWKFHTHVVGGVNDKYEVWVADKVGNMVVDMVIDMVVGMVIDRL